MTFSQAKNQHKGNNYVVLQFVNAIFVGKVPTTSKSVIYKR